MKILKLPEALAELQTFTSEIRHKVCLQGQGFEAGLISFQPGGDSDPKQIKHAQKDVVCYVLKGQGRLRLSDQTIHLEPEMVCHIPRGTAHDFAATNDKSLVLFYFLIATG